MRKHCENLTTSRREITDQTVHEEVLSADGPRGSSQRDIYRHLVKLELWANDAPNPPLAIGMGKDDDSRSCGRSAGRCRMTRVLQFVLVCAGLMLLTASASAQDESRLRISIGGAAPQDGDTGSLLALLLRPAAEELSGTELFKPISRRPEPGSDGTIWSLLATPEIDMKVGGRRSQQPHRGQAHRSLSRRGL